MNGNIVCIFDEILKEYSDKTAVIFEENHVTYKQLGAMVNAIAEQLLLRKIKKGDFIGVYLEKSPELLAASLAIIKIGAVYVPLVREYPEERIAYMVKDAGISCMIAHEENERLFDTQVLSIKKCGLLDGSKDVKEIETKKVNTEDLAYVMYTSGTTGTPKGVMIHHGGFRNRIMWQRSYFQMKPEDRVLIKAPIGFDISLWEMYLPLLSGAACVVAKENGYMEVEYLLQLIKKENVTIAQFVPSILRIIVEYFKGRKEDNGECLTTLQKIVSSGEELNVSLVKDCLSVLNQTKLYNFYGPTEASICATACLLNEWKDFTYIPLGSSISNMDVFLLDEKQNVVTKEGMKGEIYIAGIGVGKGYINKPEQTKAAFLPDLKEPKKKMYKTGDIGFFYKENIIFVGRNDQTIKIRGNRVDLGEIEAKIYETALVEETVVKCFEKEDKTQVLVAFLKENTKEKENCKVQKIKETLKQVLPKYMIPQLFITVDDFELTPNGKIDKKKLTIDLEKYSENREQDSTEAKSPAELIRKLFEQYLKQEVKDEEDFFELGGSSLEAIQILMEVNKVYQKEIAFADVMDDFSVKGILYQCASCTKEK